MAIVQNPLISRSSGSVGNSVFSKWKTKNILKSKSIAPYPAPTPAQSAQRSRFGFAVNFFSPCVPYLQYMFNSSRKKISPFNALVSKNIHLFTLTSPFFYADSIPFLRFSTSGIQGFFKTSYILQYPATVGIGGLYLFDHLSAKSDLFTVVFAVVHETFEIFCFKSLANQSTAITCVLPFDYVGKTVSFFSVQIDEKLKLSSDSLFCGTFTLI